MSCLCKQCRSRSVGFFRSQLIWIYTVCHSVCEFISVIWIKQSDWLKIWIGCGILICSAGQGLKTQEIRAQFRHCRKDLITCMHWFYHVCTFIARSFLCRVCVVGKGSKKETKKWESGEIWRWFWRIISLTDFEFGQRFLSKHISFPIGKP